MNGISRVLVYGAGMMGKGVAQVFTACPQLSILMYDVDQVDVHVPIRAALMQLAARDVISETDVEERISRVKFTTDTEKVRNFAPELVVECVFEDMALKQNVFAQLEQLCPADTIFCTNTSVMSPTEISAKLIHRERFVGTHFWNPAALIPLVEVVKTDATSERTAQTVLNLLNCAGKKAVLCQKDVPGFIANRMQHALWREAIYIIEQGIADAQTVDDAVRYSFGLRLPQLGPVENADLVGMDLTKNIHSYLLPHLCASPEPSPLIDEHLKKGELGLKSGQGFLTRTAGQTERIHRDLSEYLIDMLYGKAEK